MLIIPSILRTPATDGPRLAPRRSVRGRHGSNCEPASAASLLVVHGTDLKKGGQRRRTSNRRDQSAIRPYSPTPLETGNSPAAAAGLKDDATAGIDRLVPGVQPTRRRGRCSLRCVAD